MNPVVLTAVLLWGRIREDNIIRIKPFSPLK